MTWLREAWVRGEERPGACSPRLVWVGSEVETGEDGVENGAGGCLVADGLAGDGDAMADGGNGSGDDDALEHGRTVGLGDDATCVERAAAVRDGVAAGSQGVIGGRDDGGNTGLVGQVGGESGQRVEGADVVVVCTV